jgi:hypothetical protein
MSLLRIIQSRLIGKLILAHYQSDIQNGLSYHIKLLQHILEMELSL